MRRNLFCLAAIVGLCTTASSAQVSFDSPRGYLLLGILDTENLGSVVVADFNNDGKADLAVADDSIGQIWILPGNGDGTFQPPSAYPVNSPRSLAVADFNRDGIPDVAVSVLYSGLSILLGRGDGTFRQAVGSRPGRAPHLWHSAASIVMGKSMR